jgi:hypothetical protein
MDIAPVNEAVESKHVGLHPGSLDKVFPQGEYGEASVVQHTEDNGQARKPETGGEGSSLVDANHFEASTTFSRETATLPVRSYRPNGSGRHNAPAIITPPVMRHKWNAVRYVRVMSAVVSCGSWL